MKTSFYVMKHQIYCYHTNLSLPYLGGKDLMWMCLCEEIWTISHPWPQIESHCGPWGPIVVTKTTNMITGWQLHRERVHPIKQACNCLTWLLKTTLPLRIGCREMLRLSVQRWHWFERDLKETLQPLKSCFDIQWAGNNVGTMSGGYSMDCLKCKKLVWSHF